MITNYSETSFIRNRFIRYSIAYNAVRWPNVNFIQLHVKRKMGNYSFKLEIRFPLNNFISAVNKGYIKNNSTSSHQ